MSICDMLNIFQSAGSKLHLINLPKWILVTRVKSRFVSNPHTKFSF